MDSHDKPSASQVSGPDVDIDKLIATVLGKFYDVKGERTIYGVASYAPEAPEPATSSEDEVPLMMQSLEKLSHNPSEIVTNPKKITKPVYCAICEGEYDYNNKAIRFWIGCDYCNLLFHGKCVGLTVERGEKLLDSGKKFKCFWCVSKAQD